MTQPLRQMQLRDDDWLGRLVTMGHAEAFSVLYERYRDPLYRYCRSILWSDTEAHDAVQSTFVRALEALQRDQRDAPVRPWLFRIAHNEAISLLRRRKASDVVVDRLQQQARSVEDRWQLREDVGALFADLRQLPEPARGAIVLRELMGLSHAEIAVAQGTTVSSAKHAIFEARRALTEFARGRQMDCRQVRLAVAEDDRRVLRSRRIRAHLRSCAACADFARSRGLRGLHGLAPSISATAIAAKLFSPKTQLRWSGAEGGSVDAVSTLAGLGSTFASALMATKAASVVGALVAAGAVAVGVTHNTTHDAQSASAPSGLAGFSMAALVSEGPGIRGADRSARFQLTAPSSVVSSTQPMRIESSGVVSEGLGTGNPSGSTRVQVATVGEASSRGAGNAAASAPTRAQPGPGAGPAPGEGAQEAAGGQSGPVGAGVEPAGSPGGGSDERDSPTSQGNSDDAGHGNSDDSTHGNGAGSNASRGNSDPAGSGTSSHGSGGSDNGQGVGPADAGNRSAAMPPPAVPSPTYAGPPINPPGPPPDPGPRDLSPEHPPGRGAAASTRDRPFTHYAPTPP